MLIASHIEPVWLNHRASPAGWWPLSGAPDAGIILQESASNALGSAWLGIVCPKCLTEVCHCLRLFPKPRTGELRSGSVQHRLRRIMRGKRRRHLAQPPLDGEESCGGAWVPSVSNQVRLGDCLRALSTARIKPDEPASTSNLDFSKYAAAPWLFNFASLL